MHPAVAHEHAHDGAARQHSHEGTTGHEHVHEGAAAEQAPDSNDNLLLDIGGDTGALIVYAAAQLDQAEIEISPSAREQARSHNIVRAREAPIGSVHAAVFPALAAGDYIVWRDKVTKAGTVLVRGGQVASFRLG